MVGPGRSKRLPYPIRALSHSQPASLLTGPSRSHIFHSHGKSPGTLCATMHRLKTFFLLSLFSFPPLKKTLVSLRPALGWGAGKDPSRKCSQALPRVKSQSPQRKRHGWRMKAAHRAKRGVEWGILQRFGFATLNLFRRGEKPTNMQVCTVSHSYAPMHHSVGLHGLPFLQYFFSSCKWEAAFFLFWEREASLQRGAAHCAAHFR